VKRREFITLLGGAVAWPLAARAQQTERMRSIGMLHTPAADDPEGQARNAAFLEGLTQFGWTDGRNVRIATRWAAGDVADTWRNWSRFCRTSTLAGRHKLPAVYFTRHFVTGGGLISYGPDQLDQYRRAAGYVDRILKGENQADLPVQAPTKYELVINLKTAKALGLDVPPALLARADEAIE
jgi:ABC transporter substrate binding protein